MSKYKFFTPIDLYIKTFEFMDFQGKKTAFRIRSSYLCTDLKSVHANISLSNCFFVFEVNFHVESYKSRKPIENKNMLRCCYLT
jgi:hypothetical protein